MKFITKFLKDLVTLQKPVTATAVAGVIVTALGLHISAEAVSGVLVAVGTVAAAVEHVKG